MKQGNHILQPAWRDDSPGRDSYGGVMSKPAGPSGQLMQTGKTHLSTRRARGVHQARAIGCVVSVIAGVVLSVASPGSATAQVADASVSISIVDAPRSQAR